VVVINAAVLVFNRDAPTIRRFSQDVEASAQARQLRLNLHQSQATYTKVV
jgi:hypothetical protein